MDISKTVGINLKYLRQQTKANVKSITYFLNINWEEYMKYEKGLKELSIKLIDRICQYYCSLPSYLLFEENFDKINLYLDRCGNIIKDLNKVINKGIKGDSDKWFELHNDREKIGDFFNIINNYISMSDKLNNDVQD